MSATTQVRTWAAGFALVGDPSRLTLLLAIRHAGPICVSNLAAAAGLAPTIVSQALRLLRAHDLVQAQRRGQRMLYKLTDHRANSLLHHVPESLPTDSAAASGSA